MQVPGYREGNPPAVYRTDQKIERKLCLIEDLDLDKVIKIDTLSENLDANLNDIHNPTEKELSKRSVNRLQGEDIRNQFRQQTNFQKPFYYKRLLMGRLGPLS